MRNRRLTHVSEMAETGQHPSEKEPVISARIDPLLQVKEYAWEGFRHVRCGSREEFEELWAGAFDDLLYLQTDTRFA